MTFEDTSFHVEACQWWRHQILMGFFLFLNSFILHAEVIFEYTPTYFVPELWLIRNHTFLTIQTEWQWQGRRCLWANWISESISSIIKGILKKILTVEASYLDYDSKDQLFLLYDIYLLGLKKADDNNCIVICYKAANSHLVWRKLS